MATANKNLSQYDKTKLPNAKNFRFGIVVSEWNDHVTEGLYNGAIAALLDCGATQENIIRWNVPGSFELPSGAQMLLENTSVEAVITLGCVIRGETPHFDFVCNACAQGVKDVSIKYKKPVIFGLLTDNNVEQSRARSGGNLGNKGVEAAVTAIKMIALQRQLES